MRKKKIKRCENCYWLFVGDITELECSDEMKIKLIKELLRISDCNHIEENEK